MGSDHAGAAGPLEGLRVLELGTLIAGPFTGRLLGDFGAEVIKIAAPGRGDPIENFRPGTMVRWGLGPDELRAENPGLIYARVSGYLSYPLGSALSIPLMERFERKHLIMGAALGIGAFGMLFGFARASWLILVAGFLTTSVSNVLSNSFHIYQAEIFPTRMRATAVGTAYSLSRLSAAILPFITVAVLDNLGASAVFIGSFVLMVLLVVDVGVLGPRSTGLNLETASHDVPGGERVQAAR